MSLILSVFLAYPDWFFEPSGENWVTKMIVIVIFTLLFYMLGVAMWVEGVVRICYQTGAEGQEGMLGIEIIDLQELNPAAGSIV